MPDRVVIPAFAKINWLLHVLGLRPDGYHELETIFQSIAVHDVVTLSKADELSIVCDAVDVPADPTNLAWKAAQAMMMAFDLPPVRIELEKRVPAAGGLGGGSSNAAAVLRGMSALYELRSDPAQLTSIALTLGSDVPFFLVGGTAHATGRGEVITALPDVPSIPLILIFPEERIPTATAFRMLREQRKTSSVTGEQLGSGAARAFLAGDILDHAERLTNDLEAVVFESYPNLRTLRDGLRAGGAAWAAMSGSGSTIVAAYREESQRDGALARCDAAAIASRTISRAESLRFQS